MSDCCITASSRPRAVITATCRDRSVTITAARQGPPGSNSVPLPALPAATTISALRIVSGDGTSYAYSDPIDPVSVWSIAGLTTSAIVQGDPVTPIRNQPVSDSGWNWVRGSPVFLGAAGTLTQSPPTSGHFVIVAKVLSPQTLFIEIEEPTRYEQ